MMTGFQLRLMDKIWKSDQFHYLGSTISNNGEIDEDTSIG